MNPFQIAYQKHVFTFVANAARWGSGSNAGEPPVAQYLAYYSTVLGDGPAAYWRFDETGGAASAVSEVGSGVDGTYQNTPNQGRAKLVAGASGTAVNFGGSATSEYVTVSAGAIGWNNDWMIECWVKASASCPGASIMSEVYTGGANTISPTIGLSHTIGAPVATTYPNVGYYTGGAAWLDAEYTVALPLDQIFHMVGRRDGGNMYLYMNAVEVAATTVTASTPTTSLNNYLIARRHDTGSTADYFHGTVDQVAIFVSAMSEEVVRRHYAVGLNYVSTLAPYRVITLPDSVALFRFESDTGHETSELGVFSFASVNASTTTPIAAPAGSDGALNCDGSTNYLSGTPPSYHPSGADARTLEAWVVPDNTNPGGTIIAQSDSGATAQSFIMYMAYSGSLYFFSDGKNVGNNVTYPTTHYPVVSALNHICFSKDSGNNYAGYLNGVKIVSGTFGVSINTDDDKFSIGRREDGANTGSYFPGTIDEVAVYSSALAETKIFKNYAAGIGYASATYPFTVIADGPVGYWKLDAEATGSTVNCEVNVGHDMTTRNITVVSALASGTGDGAMWFNGTNSYLQSTKAFPTYSSASFELTVQASATGQFERFLAWNAQLPYVRFDTTAAGNIEYRVGVSPNTIITASSVTVTDVNHIIGTYKQSGQMRLYINGVVQASSTAPSSLTKVGTEPYNHIGASRTPDTWFNGTIDDVAFYPYALTSAQVSSHYAGVNS